MTLKVQELQIDGETYRLREPRLADYLRARKLENEEFVFSMLEGMVIGEDGKPIGSEGVLELPLRVLDVMSTAVGAFTAPRAAPLTNASDSPTD
jgi:hypothetical protein